MAGFPLPVIEGTLIGLRVDHLPGDRDLKPMWLWWSRTSACPPARTGCGRHSCAASTSSTPYRPPTGCSAYWRGLAFQSTVGTTGHYAPGN